jgi:hypothetical protein
MFPSTPSRHLLEAATGSHCPETGWWTARGHSAAPVFLTEGSLMPAHAGERAIWKLQGPPVPLHALAGSAAGSGTVGG